ncbi:hypothetical protein [Sphingobacterium lumbrici]|uniref:hypothetical protein n=1 Tax=Sphingobacterium lumbrici TaxID=2559600 RepID=UPI00112B7F6A|nr:hypothetical protein [Sphingobacterium lumbrici]
MRKPTTQSQRLGDTDLMQYTEQIVTKMGEAIAIFPDPVPELNEIETALTDFRLSTTEAAYRDKRAILIRRGKRKELEYLISELSKYVDTVAHNDPTIILAAGFMPTQEAQSFAGPAPKAKRLVAEPQQVGSSRIKLKVDRWKGARMYQFQFRKKGSDAPWSDLLSSKSTCTIEGLEMFGEYEFRATYIGIDPTPNYSEIVSSYVV